MAQKKTSKPKKEGQEKQKGKFVIAFTSTTHLCCGIAYVHGYIDSVNVSCILYRRHHSRGTAPCPQDTTAGLNTTCCISFISLCIYAIPRTITAILYCHTTVV